jgi:hypothetical protein
MFSCSWQAGTVSTWAERSQQLIDGLLLLWRNGQSYSKRQSPFLGYQQRTVIGPTIRSEIAPRKEVPIPDNAVLSHLKPTKCGDEREKGH